MNQISTISFIQKEVLKTILYFDVFSYPLKFDEVFENMPLKISKNELLSNLNELVRYRFIKKIDDFYLLIISNDNYVERRLMGNIKAMDMLPNAYLYSKKIASFPFMSGVYISGGLSKNYYDEYSDIDYFIVTKKNRLWLCRTIFMLYYKTLSQKNKNNFCLNYFISESDLVIPDRNDFVARELAYLLPTVNYELYQAILNENSWYKSKFENKELLPPFNCINTPEPWSKKLVELMFSGWFGNWIDNCLLHITLKHWRKKYPEMSHEDFDLQYRSRKHVCKYHSKGHQNKVLTIWQEKIKEFEYEFKIALN